MGKCFVDCDKLYACQNVASHLGDSTRKRAKLHYLSLPLTQTDWVCARSQQIQRAGRCGHAFGGRGGGGLALWPRRPHSSRLNQVHARTREDLSLPQGRDLQVRPA